MNEYVNESADIFNDDDPNTPKPSTFVRIIKLIGLAIIILIIGCLVYRCATHRYEPEVSDKIIMSEEFIELYNSSPENFEVRRYGIQKPWVDVVGRQGRLMEIKHLYYVPATRQLQITLKYNEDIVPVKYSSLPASGTSESAEKIPFEVSLVDESDKEYRNFVFETGSRERFRYIRLCFDDVDIETGETDEEGNALRHSFFVKMKMINEDGAYEDVCLGGMHKIYDGNETRSLVFDEVKVDIK